MGSKSIKSAILIGTVTVSFIVLLVLLLNFDKLRNKTPINPPINEEVEVLEQAKSDLTYEQLRAFVNDSTFFDSDDQYDIEMEEENITLQVTSLEKDIRVQILDDSGRLVSGEGFLVSVNNDETYKDIDKDGAVYIGGIKPGEYSVILKPLLGYNVDNAKTSIVVKDKLEYVAIDDISYLIKDESEIEVALEDTEEKSAIINGDETQDIESKLSGDGYTFGIDVSKYQKVIDWDAVAKSGVDFAIIRAGYRGSKTGAIVEDPYFDRNVEGANKAGIKVGLYFFTQAINEVEAVEEASVILSLARKYNIDYPLFIDTEGAGGNGRADKLDKTIRTDICDAFCQTIENAGYLAGVYASKSWYNNNLEYNKLARYNIWLAQYSENVTFDEDYHIWQYTSKGSINGIEGNVDLNISYLK